MSSWCRSVLLGMLCGGASTQLACTDAVAPRGIAPDLEFVLPSLNSTLPAARIEKVSRPATGGPSQAPSMSADEVPPELNEAAYIYRYYTVAGFTDDAHQAFGAAVMHYFANRARQTVDLKLRHNGAEVTSTSGMTEDSYFLPWHHSMFTSATLGISGTCGHAVHAAGTHRVWNEFITSNQGLLSWSPQGTSSSDDAAQTPCLQSGGPGAGGGWDDGTLYICYYYDWYDYLGAFLFREWTYCVPLNAE